MPSEHVEKKSALRVPDLDTSRLPVMPITYCIGDATRPVGDGPKILVHVCNDIGAWGRGFVVALSQRWPEPERHFRDWHRDGGNIPFELGQVQFVPVSDGIVVANLIGQHGIRSSDSLPPVRYEAIRTGLKRVAAQARAMRASVHMPRIGCGLAGGSWDVVERIVQQELSGTAIAVTVYDLASTQK